MKKLIFNLLLLSGITATAAAQAIDPVPTATTPATQIENNAVLNGTTINPYCTELYKSSWVWDKTSLSWVQRVTLVTPCPVVPNPVMPETVNCDSQGVCRTNNGTIVTKIKPGGL